MKAIYFAIFYSVIALSGMADAQDTAAGQACTEDQILLATGTPDTSYSKVAKDIIASCPMICEYQKTTGGYDNTLLLVNNEVDAGLVPIDVAEFMKRSDPGVGKLLSLVSLNWQAMHIIVASNGLVVTKGKTGNLGIGKTQDERTIIKTLRDLKGRKVAAWASGVISARMVDERIKLGLDIVEFENKEEALAAVRDGNVFALIAMGAKPLSWVSTLDRNSFTLANVDPADAQALGQPYFASKLTYQKLGVIGLNTIAAKNEIFVRNYTGKREQQLVAFRECLRANLADIKERRGAHASWNEVENIDDLAWPRYEAKGSVKPVPVVDNLPKRGKSQ